MGIESGSFGQESEKDNSQKKDKWPQIKLRKDQTSPAGPTQSDAIRRRQMRRQTPDSGGRRGRRR